MKQSHTRLTVFFGRLLFCALFVSLVSCSDDNSSNPSDNNVDAGPILVNVADKVIIATYTDLNTKAGLLETAVRTFNSTPNEANLEAARTAWRETRRPWEMSEGFLFGPVDTKGLDPSLDSWPVNTVDLDAVLAGSQTLTKSYIDGLDGTLKGFHTIEYLLFGTTGNKTPDEFTVRELNYLIALTESLRGATTQLEQSWTTAGDNFGANLRNAGESSSIYPSHKAALQELGQGIVAIADEVGNGKINDPFAQQDVTLEESRFSNNSKIDFQDNIRSIQHIYTGDYTQAGGGLDDIVKARNSTLDTQIKTEIEAAIKAIGDIPGTFTTAITQEKPSVEAAQQAVRKLQETLETKLMPLLNSL